MTATRFDEAADRGCATRFQFTTFCIALVTASAGAIAHAEAPTPTFTLPDGRVVALEPIPGRAFVPLEQPARELPAALPSPMMALPSSVDLRPQQTPIRDQGGRNTCSVFGVTAAVEAAYVRSFGLALDLSEQYLNHVQKSHWLNWNAKLPLAETQPNTNGGGNVPWQFGVLERYGLPPETTMPYIGSSDYELTSQPGDVPFGLDGVGLTQRTLDDFNLASSSAVYSIPGALQATIFPRAAAEGARYRPTNVLHASGTEIYDLDWYKTQLAQGREVAFGFACCGSFSNNLWSPGAVSGSHVMLMVGYDDAIGAFLVKNSWGGTTFPWFSYDFVTQGYVYEAASVVDVESPYTHVGAFDNPQLFLGRWRLDFDGWKGTLDIYRLPNPNDPNGDRRVGTYFDGNGTPYRVNAELSDNRIDFYIDPTDPDQHYLALQGDHFTGYIFSRDYTSMAGTMVDAATGNTWAFQASKTVLQTGSASGKLIDPIRYIGRWSFAHDGQPSTLSFTSFDSATSKLTGSYLFGGQWLPVEGTVSPDPRHLTFEIPFPGAAPQVFSGYLNGHELGVMSGTTQWQGLSFGFWAYRSRDPRPFPPICDVRPQLPQCRDWPQL